MTDTELIDFLESADATNLQYDVNSITAWKADLYSSKKIPGNDGYTDMTMRSVRVEGKSLRAVLTLAAQQWAKKP